MFRNKDVIYKSNLNQSNSVISELNIKKAFKSIYQVGSKITYENLLSINDTKIYIYFF